MRRTAGRDRQAVDVAAAEATEENGSKSQDRSLPDPAVEPTITLERAALIVGVSHRHAYNLARVGKFPAIQVGTRWVVPTARFLTTFDLGAAGSEAA